MILDTRECSLLASRLASMKQSLLFHNPILTNRHNQILSQITALENFFVRLASLSENTENALIHPISGVSGNPGWNWSGTVSGSLPNLAKGRPIKAAGSLSYSAYAGKWSAGNPYLSGSAALSFLDANLKGSASFSAFSKGNFNPKLTLSAGGDARLVSTEIQGSVGNEYFSLSADAIGEAGVVYAEASCVLSLDEQVISAQAGAAAARGECRLEADLALFKISLSLSGSLGSAEIGASYENKPGQWSLEGKAGLLAGAGVRIQIDY